MSKSTIRLIVTVFLLVLAVALIPALIPKVDNPDAGGSSTNVGDSDCKHQNLYKTYESRNDEIHYMTSRCESCLKIVDDKVSQDHTYLNGVCVNCENKCSHIGVGDDGVCLTCNASTTVFVIGTKRYAVPSNTKWAVAANSGLVQNIVVSDYVYSGVVGGNILYEVSTGRYVNTSDLIKNGGVYAFCSHNYESNCVALTDGRNHSIVIQCTICSHISREESKVAHQYVEGSKVCTACGFSCTHVAQNGGYDVTSTTHAPCMICTYCGTIVPDSVETAVDHSWENGSCTVCGYACLHNINVTDGTCLTCGWVCTHEWNLMGQCNICGRNCTHPNEVVVWKDYEDGTHGDVRTCPDCHYNYVPDKQLHVLIPCDDDCTINGMYHIRHFKCQYCTYEETYNEAHTYKYTNTGSESVHGVDCTVCEYTTVHSHSPFIEAVYDTWQCPDCEYTCTNHIYENNSCTICGRPKNYS